MRPGHGEQLIAEGDPEVAEDEERADRGVPPPARRGHVGGGADHDRRRAAAQAEMVRAFEEIPRDTDRVIFFPRAAGGAGSAGEPGHDRRALRHRDRRPRPAVGDLACRGSSAARRAPRPQGAPRARGARRPATTPAASAAPSSAPASSCAVVRERGGVGDVPRPRLPPRVGRPGRRPGATRPSETSRGVAYAYLVYPHKPILAYLPQTGQLLNEYCVEFPDETRPYGSAAPARLRRRARQVDGAARATSAA